MPIVRAGLSKDQEEALYALTDAVTMQMLAGEKIAYAEQLLGVQSSALVDFPSVVDVAAKINAPLSMEHIEAALQRDAPEEVPA